MKIITNGKIIKAEQKITCPKCEAVLLIEPQDLKSTSEYGTFTYMCPWCHRHHSLTKTELNEDMLFELRLK